MGHPNHLDGSVDKGEDFIKSGMTLITEVESEKWLNKARSIKQKEELYPIPEDRLSRQCGGSGGFDDYVEWWAE
ncbi:MAG TPA: hypothetical protein PLI52_04250 [Prochlorococcaceae cyanobacterium AMR_MDS_5431]|nr:hypothetical protein [Prochlorococcaceae cyanobacterium AMR_MDS_5431]